MKRKHDFILRNFLDKVKDIAEQTYGGRWCHPDDGAVIDRKWVQFPFTNQKVTSAVVVIVTVDPNVGEVQRHDQQRPRRRLHHAAVRLLQHHPRLHHPPLLL